MPISDLMTKHIISVTPSTTVGELQPLFKLHNIHHLLVVEHDHLYGILSDRDVLKNLSPFANTLAEDKKDAFTLQRSAAQIMATNVVTIKPEAGIRDACELLLDKEVSLLPVIAEDKLIGVVSWKDILRHFLK